jgi:hypothetical protein
MWLGCQVPSVSQFGSPAPGHAGDPVWGVRGGSAYSILLTDVHGILPGLGQEAGESQITLARN